MYSLATVSLTYVLRAVPQDELALKRCEDGEVLGVSEYTRGGNSASSRELRDVGEIVLPSPCASRRWKGV